MALEDFEKELATQAHDEQKPRGHKRRRSRSSENAPRHHHHHHYHHHHSSRHKDGDERRYSRSHRAKDRPHKEGHGQSNSPHVTNKPDKTESQPEESIVNLEDGEGSHSKHKPLQRDAWMQAPSSIDIEYKQSRPRQAPLSKHVPATEADYTIKSHDKEINHSLRNEDDESITNTERSKDIKHEVDYMFGDAGSSWRMTKLKAVYRQAKESGKPLEEIAIERFGDLRTFDDAREEEIELDRWERLGDGYVGKEKPNGDLFQERKLEMGVGRDHTIKGEVESEDEFEAMQAQVMKEKPSPAKTVALDSAALNKLKAQALKAKIKGSSDAAELQRQYDEAMAGQKESGVVVLNHMDNRMLAGGRKGEVTSVDNKRGRERGLVEENQDMSIEDMVRQERRSKNQFSEVQSLADRIAGDSKFDDDLEYLDENAARLARSAPKSEINLRNTAIEQYRKTQKMLENCPLCYHEDTNRPPLAPVVSLATRVFLTLPTSPEITPYGLCTSIVPIQHHRNLLECDDDEWEEIRNFMKSLTRFYYAQSPRFTVIFYENAAQDGMKRHASLEAVPLPLELGDNVLAFFREHILTSDEEWSQHKKIINTLEKSENGMGKLAFRRSMVSELPYFHVWFKLDGGLGHVVEDTRRWPKGDLFAREVIGGMLDVPGDVVRRQGRWRKGDLEMEKRVRQFRKGWAKWDWTAALVEADNA